MWCCAGVTLTLKSRLKNVSLRKNEGHPSRLEGKFEGKVGILRESLREYLGAIFKV